jgi:hypothetical protein
MCNIECAILNIECAFGMSFFGFLVATLGFEVHAKFGALIPT